MKFRFRCNHVDKNEHSLIQFDELWLDTAERIWHQYSCHSCNRIWRTLAKTLRPTTFAPYVTPSTPRF